MASCVPALLIGILMIAGCSAPKPPPEPRTPAEIAFPTPDDWRDAARDLASIIRDKATAYEIAGPMELAPIQGNGPAYFRDLLLSALLDHDVQISGAEAAAKIACRATPIGLVPRPRGLPTPSAAPSGEILILCVIEREGTYVAAAQRTLSMSPGDQRPTRGIVIEVTG